MKYFTCKTVGQYFNELFQEIDRFCIRKKRLCYRNVFRINNMKSYEYFFNLFIF